MEHKSIIASLLVLSVIVAGMFVFAFIKKQEIEVVNQSDVAKDTIQTNDPYKEITRIDAKHFFEEGTHTLVGEVILPTRCDLLNWSVAVQESMPETAVVDFTVVNNSNDCEEVPTSQRFKISFDASVTADIKARFMKRNIELNLIPASPGESPDNYELFIKG